MKNHLLTQALKVSQEELEDVIPADQAEEVFSELSEASTDNTIEQVMADENEVDHAIEQIDVIRDMVNGAEVDSTSLESLSRLVDTVAMRYGQKEVTSLENLGSDDIKQNILGRLDHIQSSLESALVVSQESWSVKDLWDRAGGVERNAAELNSASKQLDSNKEWFSDNGIIINSLGQLKYMSVNEQFTKGIVKDTDITAAHVTSLIGVAEEADDVCAKIAAMVKAANVASDGDAVALLNKVVTLKNPFASARQKLDNVHLLNNERANFILKPLANPTGFDMKSWTNLGRYEKTSLDKVKHGTKASALLRFPAWVLGYTVGGSVVGTMLKGAGIAGGLASFGAAVMIGFAASGALNDRKKAKNLKHSISYNDIRRSFDDVVSLANKTASKRRQLPGLFRKATERRDETVKYLDSLLISSGTEGKQAIKIIRNIYISTDRLSWSLNQWAFGIMETMTSNTNAIARKMVKASKK